jgi:subtilisin family serine protease
MQASTLKRSHSSVRQRLSSKQVIVNRSFSITMNALVVNKSVTLEEAQQLLPGEVLSVFEDKEVHTTLSESVPLTKAPDLWRLSSASGVPLTGRGVRIGILDTGIDYTHPDLGGCTRTSNISDGRCSKVAGGYDFTNNDTDPFDDHGHGTHCAAIAAGQGMHPGMAPDATLYAYKVLSRYGSGSFSDIIAAIERSADPNGDGNVSDHLDVISLSLGSYNGDPNDAASLALDRAMSLGVVAVVAAGNEGPNERTISSPGSSRRAITVGAFSSERYLASFSSRGPVLFKEGSTTYSLSKPDVVAPGVSICAALSSEHAFSTSGRLCMDSQHVALSGTSMATPHVAGLAALLQQGHPTWNPDQIKAAIKSGASRSLLTSDYILNDIGSGAIDALTAYQAPQGAVAIEEISTAAQLAEVSLRVPVGWSYSLARTSETLINRLNTAPWQTVATGTSPAQSFVTTFDTSTMSQGGHTVRLVARSPAGETLTDLSSVSVQRFELTSPAEADVVNIHDALPVSIRRFGDASATSLVIEYSINEGPWRSDGAVASLSTLSGSIRLPAATSTYKLKVRVRLGTAGGEDSLLVGEIRVDPKLKPGFPIRVNAECGHTNWGYSCQENWVLHPAVADIDGDGTKEILVWRKSQAPKPNEILIFNQRGSLVRTFALNTHPVQVNFSINQFSPWPIIVTDLDGDGSQEIVVVESFRPYRLWPTAEAWDVQVVTVLNSQGEVREGFPLVLDGLNKGFVVSDLNHDGRKEIIIQSIPYGGLEAQTVQIVSDDGTTMGRVRIPAPSGGGFSGQLQIGPNPVVGNFDSDDDLEVAVTTNSYPEGSAGQIESNRVATTIVNWNQFDFVPSGIPSTVGVLFGSPVALDADRDGVHELSIPIYPTGDNLSRVQHVRFTGSTPSLSEFSVDISDPSCSSSTSLFCGTYAGGLTLGRFKGERALSVFGLAGSYWGSRAQLHQFRAGVRVGSAGPAFTTINPQSPAIFVDVTGDGENDALFNSSGSYYYGDATRGVVALTSESNYTENRVFSAEIINEFFSPSVADIDNDGLLDIVAGSLRDRAPSKPINESWKKRFSIYAFSTSGPASSAVNNWASFMGNADHNGCLDCERPVVPLFEAAPVITSQPVSASVASGSSVVLSVSAYGEGVRYQWEHSLPDVQGWFPIKGANASTLEVVALNGQTATYRVRVSGKTRSTMSAIATVTGSVDQSSMACPSASLKSYYGVCGCNVADVDTDFDGTVDCVERDFYTNIASPTIKRMQRGKRITIELPVVQNASRYSVILQRLRNGTKVIETLRRSGKGRRFTFEKLRPGTYRIRWSASIAAVPGLSKVSGAMPLAVR